MVIRFWGVRGSLPAPLLPTGVKEKISTILERMVPEDVANAESKEHFLAGLPPWLNSTVGGNSLCVSVDIENFPEPLVFDCGSGIREMGIAYGGSNSSSPVSAPLHYHIFVSHFHGDHVIGFPFFGPAYNPLITLDFYSPKPGLAECLGVMMSSPFFPVQLEHMMSQKEFHFMENSISIGPATVAFRKMNHPGDSFAYLLTHNGKRFIYATDAELLNADFELNEENAGFFKDADLIILDSQYTLGEAIEKYNWGHSAFSLAVEFAAQWRIKHLVLFHHDPTYDDRKLYGILQSAQWYLQRMGIKEMEITLATEGLEIEL